MDSPTLDGRSIEHTRNYTSGMNVHFSSGIFNKASQKGNEFEANWWTLDVLPASHLGQ